MFSLLFTILRVLSQLIIILRQSTPPKYTHSFKSLYKIKVLSSIKILYNLFRTIFSFLSNQLSIINFTKRSNSITIFKYCDTIIEPTTVTIGLEQSFD